MQTAPLTALKSAVNARISFIRVNEVDDVEKTIEDIENLFPKHAVYFFTCKKSLINELEEHGDGETTFLDANFPKPNLYLAMDMWKFRKQIEVQDPLISVVFLETSRNAKIKRIVQKLTKELSPKFSDAINDLKALDYKIFDACDSDIIEDVIALSLVKYKRVTAETIQKSSEFFVDGHFSFRLAGEKT